MQRPCDLDPAPSTAGEQLDPGIAGDAWGRGRRPDAARDTAAMEVDDACDRDDRRTGRGGPGCNHGAVARRYSRGGPSEPCRRRRSSRPRRPRATQPASARSRAAPQHHIDRRRAICDGWRGAVLDGRAHQHRRHHGSPLADVRWSDTAAWDGGAAHHDSHGGLLHADQHRVRAHRARAGCAVAPSRTGNHTVDVSCSQPCGRSCAAADAPVQGRRRLDEPARAGLVVRQRPSRPHLAHSHRPAAA